MEREESIAMSSISRVLDIQCMADRPHLFYGCGLVSKCRRKDVFKSDGNDDDGLLYGFPKQPLLTLLFRLVFIFFG